MIPLRPVQTGRWILRRAEPLLAAGELLLAVAEALVEVALTIP